MIGPKPKTPVISLRLLLAFALLGSALPTAALGERSVQRFIVCSNGKPALLPEGAGTSVAQNLAAMVSVPSDLCHGRSLSDGLAEPQARAIDRLRQPTPNASSAAPATSAKLQVAGTPSSQPQ